MKQNGFPTVYRYSYKRVYGATGFAGKQATEYLFHSNLTPRWSISDGNVLKLHNRIRDIPKKYVTIHSAPAILTADALGPVEGLQRTVARALVFINCASPFVPLGKLVVTAAVAAGTHYVDITVESAHILGTALALHDIALEKGRLVVPTFGCDHIHSDIGRYVMVSEQLCPAAAKKGATVPEMAMDIFAETISGPCGYSDNTGTLDTVWKRVFCARKTIELEKKMNEKYWAQLGGTVVSYKPKLGFGMGRDPRAGLDNPIVRMNVSEMFAVQRTSHLVDMGIGAWNAGVLWGGFQGAFQFAVLGCAANNERINSHVRCCGNTGGGTEFVLKQPHFFTWGLNGPTEEKLENTGVQFTIIGRASSGEGIEVACTVVHVKLDECGFIGIGVPQPFRIHGQYPHLYFLNNNKFSRSHFRKLLLLRTMPALDRLFLFEIVLAEEMKVGCDLFGECESNARETALTVTRSGFAGFIINRSEPPPLHSPARVQASCAS